MVRIAAMPIMSIIANGDDLAMLQGVRHGQEASGMLSSSRLHSEDDTMPDVVGTASMLQSIADRISTNGVGDLDEETMNTLAALAANLHATQEKMDAESAREEAHLTEIISNFTTGESACADPRAHSHVSGFGGHHANTSRDLDACFRERDQIHTDMDAACQVAHSELTNEAFLTLGAASTQSVAFNDDVAVMEAPEECQMPAELVKDAHGLDSVEQHLNNMLHQIEARKTAWAACVQKAEDFKTKDAACAEAAEAFEGAFCSERLNFLVACHDYEVCYVSKSGSFESEWELVQHNMRDRQTLNVHIETLKCMMTALREATTQAVHTSFEICKDNSQNTTWKGEQRQRFHLDESELPFDLSCQAIDLEPTRIHPGTAEWAYKMEGTAFTSNGIISRCTAMHSCDPVPAIVSGAAGLTQYLESNNIHVDPAPEPEPEVVVPVTPPLLGR